MLSGVGKAKAGVVDRAPFKTICHLIIAKGSRCKFNSKFYLGENPLCITLIPRSSHWHRGGMHLPPALVLGGWGAADCGSRFSRMSKWPCMCAFNSQGSQSKQIEELMQRQTQRKQQCSITAIQAPCRLSPHSETMFCGFRTRSLVHDQAPKDSAHHNAKGKPSWIHCNLEMAISTSTSLAWANTPRNAIVLHVSTAWETPLVLSQTVHPQISSAWKAPAPELAGVGLAHLAHREGLLFYAAIEGWRRRKMAQCKPMLSPSSLPIFLAPLAVLYIVLKWSREDIFSDFYLMRKV